MNGASLRGGYKLPECDDSGESFGLLFSALVMFLKHWLSNQRGTEGVMQPWWIFPPVAVPDSLIFFFSALDLLKTLFCEGQQRSAHLHVHSGVQ